MAREGGTEVFLGRIRDAGEATRVRAAVDEKIEMMGDWDTIQIATVAGEGWTLNAIFTPGHMSNHHCFALVEENTLFSGDHVMGWNSTIVAPPDGNMREYFASLDRCAKREDAAYWPGHGPEIPNPQSYVRALTAHRRLREDEIAACLKDGVTTILQMVARMYRHLPQAMHGAAARAVFAHVEHMVETGRVLSDGPVTPQARYRLPG